MVLQLVWIRQLFKLDPAGYRNLDAVPGPSPEQDSNEDPIDTLDEVEATRTAVAYAPIYALGNLCIGASRMSSIRF